MQPFGDRQLQTVHSLTESHTVFYLQHNKTRLEEFKMDEYVVC